MFAGERSEFVALLFGRWSKPHQFNSTIDLGFRRFRLVLDARREGLAVMQYEVIIVEGQRLKGGSRKTAHGCEQAEVGEVERLHEWISNATPDESVDAPAIRLRL